MHSLLETAPAFVEMAHRIVWCSAATVDRRARLRSRIVHPIWEWDGTHLVGWVGTRPGSPKVAHIAANPFISLNYWTANHDTCLAECHAEFSLDDQLRTRVWELFVRGPAPVGYDPSTIPGWEAPTSPGFGVLRLVPWHLRVLPASVMQGSGGGVLSWSDRAAGSGASR